MIKNKLLALAFLIGCLLLSSFHSWEANTLLPVAIKQPTYLAALDSLAKNYLAKDIPSQNRMWNLHKLLINRLKKAGIDTVLFYQSGCVGCEDLPARGDLGKPVKNCRCAEDELTVYLFWLDKGKTLTKRLDCCQNQPALAGNTALINFYFQNQSYFLAGEKFFRDFEEYNRRHPKAVKFLPPTSIHDDVTTILFYLNNRIVKFQIRRQDFTALGYPKYLRYPWKRKQWEWAKLIEKSVAEK